MEFTHDGHQWICTDTTVRPINHEELHEFCVKLNRLAKKLHQL